MSKGSRCNRISIELDSLIRDFAGRSQRTYINASRILAIKFRRQMEIANKKRRGGLMW